MVATVVVLVLVLEILKIDGEAEQQTLPFTRIQDAGGASSESSRAGDGVTAVDNSSAVRFNGVRFASSIDLLSRLPGFRSPRNAGLPGKRPF